MVDARKALASELEAVILGLQRKVAEHQQSVTKLAQMVNGSEPNQYQLSVWTTGAAAQTVTEIAGLLSQQQTLQKALALLDEAQE
jgi:hypothetical protein